MHDYTSNTDRRGLELIRQNVTEMLDIQLCVQTLRREDIKEQLNCRMYQLICETKLLMEDVCK